MTKEDRKKLVKKLREYSSNLYEIENFTKKANILLEEENISKDYLMYEETYKDENNNVVTVSVENLKTLKKAYPNYFLDAREFVATINKIIL